MATETRQIRVRRDTAANWVGIIPANGEPIGIIGADGLVTAYKIGDGVTRVEMLPALSKGDQGEQGPQGLPGTNGVATDAAVAQNAGTDGTATRAALNAGWNAKNSVIINARDFGADSSADAPTNTNAIAAALAAGASLGLSADVYLPSGTYKITNVVIPAGTSLRGDWAWSYGGAPSKGTTLRVSDPAATGYLVDLGQSAALRNIALVGAGRSNTPQHDGVLLRSLGVLENVTIAGVRHGVNGNFTSANKIVRCQINTNSGDGIRNIVDSQVYDSYLNANAGHGINLQSGANDNAIALNKIEWNDGYGVVLFSNGANVVGSNIIDRNGKAGMLITSAYRFVVSMNQFRRNGRLSQGVTGDDTHIHLESNLSGIVGMNETHSGVGDKGEGYNSPSSSLYTLANGPILINGNDLAGCTGSPIVSAGSGTEQLIGNAGLAIVQNLRATRANVGSTPVAVPSGQAASVTFALTPMATYSRGDGYEISVVTRNESSGNRAIDGVYCVVIREGGDAAVQLGSQSSRFGTSAVSVSGAVSANGATLTLTLTNTAGANLTALVSLRQL